jgi:hypothetical protein
VDDLPRQPPPSEPSAQSPPVQTASVALFDHGVLAVCVDVRMLIFDQVAQELTKGRRAPVPSNLAAEDVEIFLKAGDSVTGDLVDVWVGENNLFDTHRQVPDGVQIAKPCAEQFCGTRDFGEVRREEPKGGRRSDG